MLIDMEHPDAFKYEVFNDKGERMQDVVGVDTNLNEYTLVEKDPFFSTTGRKVTLHRAKSIVRDPWKFKIIITPLDDDAP